ncbi:SPAC6G9.14 [Symbiodinium sp. KB8]|nr:SPAC6G9.14 [Symbiodinium sp. KB8]
MTTCEHNQRRNPLFRGQQDLLYTAACGGDLDPASLDVQCDMSLSDGSELPEPLRLTFRDEHPLMLGSANVCAQLQSLVLGGHAALRQDLPMQRKRDLLQLPTADFRFKAALSLEEETSFVDDGFSTVPRFLSAELKAPRSLIGRTETHVKAKLTVAFGLIQSSSPGSGRLERRSLGRPTASLAQRSANTASFTPMSVQLQKWVTPLGLQKDAQSLAALALAVVGNPVAMADGISGPSIASDSPEHAGSAACAREEAADSTVLLARLCADSSMEDVHSKTASQPEVERPSVVAQDSPSDRDSTDGEIRALRFDTVSMISWQEVAPDSDGGCGDSSDLSELEDLGRLKMVHRARCREGGERRAEFTWDLFPFDSRSGSMELMIPSVGYEQLFQADKLTVPTDCTQHDERKHAVIERLKLIWFADDLHTLEGKLQSEANMKLGEFRAQVGDIALAIPSTAEVKLKVVEAEINAEGIGQTHLQVSWDGLGRPHLKHTAKQRSVTFPQPPSASGLTVRIGDMGQMGITLDDEPDVAECGNRLLDDEAWFVPLLELADTMNLQPAVKRLLNLSRVVRNVLRTEGIEEPKDVIPTRRMARVIARILQEIGTDGKHVADAITKLEDDIRGVVEGAVLGKGLDVAKITRLLWAFASGFKQSGVLQLQQHPRVEATTKDELKQLRSRRPTKSCSSAPRPFHMEAEPATTGALPGSRNEHSMVNFNEDFCDIRAGDARFGHVDVPFWLDLFILRLLKSRMVQLNVSNGVSLEDALPHVRKLPRVPEVFNPGPDGMPQLPDVDKLMTEFQDVKHTLNSQASSFAAHLSQAAFDARLRAQENVNQAVAKDNAHLATEIVLARQNREELKKKVKQEDQLISFRRTELKALEQQLAKGEKFLHRSLDANDPTKDVSFLHLDKVPSRSSRIEEPSTPAKDQEESEGCQGLPALEPSLNITTSLSKEKTASTEEEERIIGDLTRELRQLHKAEMQSESKLNELFHASFQAGKQRHAALLAQQSLLKNELDQTTAQISKLQEAFDHLKAKLNALEGDLHQEGLFFADLEKVAMASTPDVPALLKAVTNELPDK